MHRPEAFREDRLEILQAAIRAHPLATLITAGPGGLMANLVPFTLIEGGQRGVLRAHLARANGQLAELAACDEALVMLQGPQAYITPSWYASKREHGKVVPTWNYVAVQARGRPAVMDEAGWVREQIGALTTQQEASRAEPWAVTDAPDAYIAAQLRGIVGVEIPIDRLEGKWKVSQNRGAADRQGVEAGLGGEAEDEAMARLVAQAGS